MFFSKKKLHYFLFAFFFFGACEYKKNIDVYHIKKEVEEASFDPSQRFKWQAESSWIPVPSTDITQLSVYLIADSEDTYQQKLEKMLKLSLALFAGDAGGLEKNIKRWKEQLGLSENSTDVKIVPFSHSSLQTAYLIELNNQKTGMGLISVVFQLPEETLFAKMEGPIVFLKKQKKVFLQFVTSITQIKG